MDLLQEENNQERRGKQCSSHRSIHVDRMMKRNQDIQMERQLLQNLWDMYCCLADGKNWSTIKDVLSTRNQSSSTDSLQEENKQKKEGRQYSSHHSTRVGKTMKKKQFTAIWPFQGSFIIAADGDMIKMRFIGEIWRKHRIWCCNSGKRSLMLLLYMIQCFLNASLRLLPEWTKSVPREIVCTAARTQGYLSQ